METINVYSAKELKEINPVAFEYAHQQFQKDMENDEIPWQHEIMGSLKSLLKYAGIELRDWSIGIYGHCYIKFSIPTYWNEVAEYDDVVDNLTGKKAYKWLKETFDLKSYRRVNYKNHLGKQSHRYDFTKLNSEKDWDWSCEFTGLWADHDFLESLFDCVHDGMTIEDAVRNLADVAGKLFEQEYESMMSEENFLEMSDCNDWKFTEDGTQI